MKGIISAKETRHIINFITDPLMKSFHLHSGFSCVKRLEARTLYKPANVTIHTVPESSDTCLGDHSLEKIALEIECEGTLL